MGTVVKDPKQKRAVENKERLIKSAFKLFLENGFYNTNSKEIAQEAGVSTGLFYNYFNDKSDIFCVILNRTLEKNYSNLKKVLGEAFKQKNKEEILRRFINQGIESVAEMQYIYQDIEIVKKQYPKIGEVFLANKEMSKNLLMDYIKKVNENVSLEISCMKSNIIATTITANCVEIARISDKKKQEEAINLLLDIVNNIVNY
ncbi:MAG: TetR/AcrR family transcriptional regulator [Clostridium sp.]|nr:TetR/AcrR family transcriptional regulator [Clostridium sp.]